MNENSYTNVIETSLKVIFEHIQISFASLEFIILKKDFSFHAFLPELQICDNETKVVVDCLEMEDLLIHRIQLFLHFRDLFFSRTFVPFQFLDFVIKDITELLKLQLLLPEFVDSLSLFLNGLLSFLNIHEASHLFIVQKL